MKILKAIQHQLTSEQILELNEKFNNPEIINFSDVNPELFKKIANSPSDVRELSNLAEEFGKFCNMYDGVVLPIGSPAFNHMLRFKIIVPVLFAHSERQSVDELQPDGSVKKINIFKHVKFICI